MTAKRIIRVRSRPLVKALVALGRSGARLPSLGIGGYRISLDPSKTGLYVSARGAFLGAVRPSGLLVLSPSADRRATVSLRALIETPLAVARGAAILAGKEARCAVCGRLLDRKDLARGIGPGCWASGNFDLLEKETTAGKTISVRIGSRRTNRRA